MENGDYQGAIDKLENDIRSKCDGSLGGDSNNDWITDPEAQRDINVMIDKYIAYLVGLIYGVPGYSWKILICASGLMVFILYRQKKKIVL